MLWQMLRLHNKVELLPNLQVIYKYGILCDVLNLSLLLFVRIVIVLCLLEELRLMHRISLINKKSFGFVINMTSSIFLVNIKMQFYNFYYFSLHLWTGSVIMQIKGLSRAM